MPTTFQPSVAYSSANPRRSRAPSAVAGGTTISGVFLVGAGVAALAQSSANCCKGSFCELALRRSQVMAGVVAYGTSPCSNEQLIILGHGCHLPLEHDWEIRRVRGGGDRTYCPRFPVPLWSPQLSQRRECCALLDALPARLPSIGDQRRQTHSQPRVTNAATTANPAAPTSSCCHRGRALTHDANWLTRVRARRSRRLAQANSVAHTPMPRKMISQPGPGNGRRITPTTTMASPIIAIPTRQTVSPAGSLCTRPRVARTARRHTFPFDRSGGDTHRR